MSTALHRNLPRSEDRLREKREEREVCPLAGVYDNRAEPGNGGKYGHGIERAEFYEKGNDVGRYQNEHAHRQLARAYCG